MAGEGLTAALKDARDREAARLDALFAVRDTQSLRLLMLRDAVVAETADNAEARALFDISLQQGATPRLWLDLISSVEMEPDPKTYRLVQTRGDVRETLFESPDLEAMKRFVLGYLAHRMVAHSRQSAAASGVAEVAAPAAEKPVAPVRAEVWPKLVLAWLFGLVCGALALAYGVRAGLADLPKLPW